MVEEFKVPWLKGAQIKTIIKRYMKPVASELGFEIHSDGTLYRVINDIVQAISFDFSWGHFYCKVFVRPLYYAERAAWVLSIDSSLEDIKDRKLISAYDLETEEQVNRKLKYVEDLIREDALEWFQKYNTAEKIRDEQNDEELVAYSYLYIKDYEKGKELIEKLCKEYDFDLEDSKDIPEWQIKNKEDFEQMLTYLQTDTNKVDAKIQEIIHKVRQNMKIK